MIDSVDVEALNDGTCRIWCKTTEKLGILTGLHWGRLEILKQHDAASSRARPTFIIVRGSYSDVSSALASTVKTIRPLSTTQTAVDPHLEEGP